MTSAISLKGVSRHYRGHTALDDVSVDIERGAVTGLLGRNGAGKSTLMRIIAGQEFPSAGEVRVLGADPAKEGSVLRHLILVREDQTYPDLSVRRAVEAASWFAPRWNPELARDLLEEFNLPPGRSVQKLSRGMRSALGIVIGLSTGAEVMLFDEPYAGLDAVARRRFYDLILAEYSRHRPTVVLSTHLVDESADLLERVVMIDRGRVVVTAAADQLRGAATRVSGPAIAVEAFVEGRLHWERWRLGQQESVLVGGAIDEHDRLQARELGVRLQPLSLQETFVHGSASVEDVVGEGCEG